MNLAVNRKTYTSEVDLGTKDRVRIESVTSMDQLSRHRDVWNELASQVEQPSPVLSYEWIRTYLEQRLSPLERWLCLLAYNGSELVGVLPVVAMKKRRFGFNRLILQTPHDLHTTSVDFLVARGWEGQVVPLILETLERAEPCVSRLIMHRLPASSPALLLSRDNNTAPRIFREFDGYGSFVKVTGTFEDYEASLGSNFRKNLKKLEKKLATLADLKTAFLTGNDVLGDHLKKFLSVEASGWKGRQGTAIADSPQEVSFYITLTNRLAKLGWLEWHFLEAGQKTIAGQLAVRVGRSLVIYKIGYDEAFAFCGPGTLLFRRTVERAFRLHDIDEINCLTDLPWHDNWHMAKQEYYNLILYPDRLRRFFFGSLPVRARALLREVPGLRPVVRLARSLIH